MYMQDIIIFWRISTVSTPREPMINLANNPNSSITNAESNENSDILEALKAAIKMTKMYAFIPADGKDKDFQDMKKNLKYATDEKVLGLRKLILTVFEGLQKSANVDNNGVLVDWSGPSLGWNLRSLVNFGAILQTQLMTLLVQMKRN